ncbi:RidA family protein [Jannaschia aquimarina]|uniref:YabJ protein n=1 Tax=Jannaschia aquimarina TaxID=935700 RepID=A0A0D1CJJ4_9RHOB|nr:RidA family protein [Jannaschia aquimarina]KIT14857.1 Enamine/imine deaminase [Jannaschia aquimarina]SNS57685.1 Enamine deaminase RidA, house cleaning of reactive enamine intermediates, YjgF/YER057c/UK114 family [Jannaschia aquimarina]
MTPLTPSDIAPPFGAYSHGILAPAGGHLVVTSGQLALATDGTVPDDARRQADLCLSNIAAILAEAGAGPRHIIRLNAYVTDRAHFLDYMAARDAWLDAAGVAVRPASTLLIVSGFTREEFLVEVEATAWLPGG